MSHTEQERVESKAKETFEKLRQAVAELRGLREVVDEAANRVKERTVNEAKAQFEKHTKEAEDTYGQAVQDLQTQVKTFLDVSPALTAPWTN